MIRLDSRSLTPVERTAVRNELIRGFQIASALNSRKFMSLLPKKDSGPLETKLADLMSLQVRYSLDREQQSLPLKEEVLLLQARALEHLAWADRALETRVLEKEKKTSLESLTKINDGFLILDKIGNVPVDFYILNALNEVINFIKSMDSVLNGSTHPGFNAFLKESLKRSEKIALGYPHDLLIFDRALCEENDGGIILVDKERYSSRYFLSAELEEAQRSLVDDTHRMHKILSKVEFA